MEEKLNGIVLGGVNYGENDKILSVYTLEKGAVSARMKGVKKAGAKLKFASEPFCFAEFIIISGTNKNNIINASLIDSFYPLRENVEKYFCAGAVTEYVKRFMKEGIVSENMFTLLLSALKTLSYGQTPPKSAVAEFLFSALSLSGYALNLNGCPGCGEDLKGKTFFDYDSGGFYCENCRSDIFRQINFSTYSYLKKLSEGQTLTDEQALPVLRLFDYYITNKAEENIFSLKEIIKM